MKTFVICSAFLFVVATALCALNAQSTNAPQQSDRDGFQQSDGRPPHGHDRPPHPLLFHFDTDRDGQISAAEIAAASSVLKQLDENGDGALADEELPPPPHPPHHDHFGGPGGERGPEGMRPGGRRGEGQDSIRSDDGKGHGKRGKRGKRGPRPRRPADDDRSMGEKRRYSRTFRPKSAKGPRRALPQERPL